MAVRLEIQLQRKLKTASTQRLMKKPSKAAQRDAYRIMGKMLVKNK